MAWEKFIFCVCLPFTSMLLHRSFADSKIIGPNKTNDTLMEELVTRNLYSKRIAPVVKDISLDKDIQTEVFLKMYPYSILDINEKTEIMVMSIKLVLYWKDCSLKWEGNNPQYMTLKQSDIWTPHLLIVNSASKNSLANQFGHKDGNVYVVNKGSSVLWDPQVIVSSQCDIDIRYFPFDYQMCDITIGYAELPPEYIDILQVKSSDLYCHYQEVNKELAPTFDFSHYNDDGTWEITDYAAYNLRNDDDKQNRLKYTFLLRRKSTFYFMTLITPLLILSTGTCVIFLIPESSQSDKIGTSITLELAYAVYLSIMSDYLPETSSDISLLMVYINILFGYTAIATLISVYILAVCARHDSNVPVGKRWKMFAKIVPSSCSYLQLKQADDQCDDNDEQEPNITWIHIAKTLDLLMCVFSGGLTFTVNCLMMGWLMLGSTEPTLQRENITDNINFYFKNTTCVENLSRTTS